MAADAGNSMRTGLLLSGGGARAAYQVGVLKAICECLPRHAVNPFPVICGTSAGAINAAALAVYGQRYHEAVARMLRVWRNFRVQQVFRADATGIAKAGAHWLAALMLGGLGRRNPQALLDRAPLRELLNRYLPCERIADNLASGALDAVGITASGYSSGESVTFYQSRAGVESWRRARRVGTATTITVDHLMASSAIPFMFAAEHLNREYFGDGSMRQTAPLSPVLHLGANRILVIGVTNERESQPPRPEQPPYPSLAQIAGHILNSIFLDSLEADLERLRRINRTVALIPSHQLEEGGVALRHVEVLTISPSQDIQAIAQRHVKDLPWTIRFLLRGLGGFRAENSSALASYLLFERGFCSELISLGYADAMQRRDELMNFLVAQAG